MSSSTLPPPPSDEIRYGNAASFQAFSSDVLKKCNTLDEIKELALQGQLNESDQQVLEELISRNAKTETENLHDSVKRFRNGEGGIGQLLTK